MPLPVNGARLRRVGPPVQTGSKHQGPLVNELVTPRAKTADGPRTARKGFRVLGIEAIGPITALGRIVWAIAQPYRVTFFYPEGKEFWDWVVQPPLLVVLVGLLFSLFVAPGLVEDIEQADDTDAAAG